MSNMILIIRRLVGKVENFCCRLIPLGMKFERTTYAHNFIFNLNLFCNVF